MAKIAFKKENDTGIVYKINCYQCKKTYIGETKRQAKTRFKEHKAYIRNKCDTSVMSKHIENNQNHEFDFDNFQILDRENNTRKRKVSEMLHIRKFNDETLNLKTDLNNLSHTYNPVYKIFK